MQGDRTRTFSLSLTLFLAFSSNRVMSPGDQVSCAKKLGPVCASPKGGLKSKPQVIPTFFTYWTN